MSGRWQENITECTSNKIWHETTGGAGVRSRGRLFGCFSGIRTAQSTKPLLQKTPRGSSLRGISSRRMGTGARSRSRSGSESLFWAPWNWKILADSPRMTVKICISVAVCIEFAGCWAPSPTTAFIGTIMSSSFYSHWEGCDSDHGHKQRESGRKTHDGQECGMLERQFGKIVRKTATRAAAKRKVRGWQSVYCCDSRTAQYVFLRIDHKDMRHLGNVTTISFQWYTRQVMSVLFG
ncbi:hypothetical protein BC835DRAFT_1315490 [Cytidiella melzeri]|nr:hypothetical protein BC835DRAFT_1315490 [Cytidiella melzeri]